MERFFLSVSEIHCDDELLLVESDVSLCVSMCVLIVD